MNLQYSNEIGQDAFPELSPQLSALEASLASLEPAVRPGDRDAVKADALLNLFRRNEKSVPALTGEQLIETIVRSGDREITLSLKEYVKSTRWTSTLFGVALGLIAGLLIGLILGTGTMLLLFKPLTTPVMREIQYVPYITGDPVIEHQPFLPDNRPPSIP